MLINIDQVTETTGGDPIDISINSDLLNAITLDIYESHSMIKIFLTFDHDESDEKFNCHMCRLNELITYLDSTMTGFYKIDDTLGLNRLIYVNLSKISLIKKMHHSVEKTKMQIEFIKGESVVIVNESEMEKLKQAMMNLNTIKKKVKMRH